MTIHIKSSFETCMTQHLRYLTLTFSDITLTFFDGQDLEKSREEKSRYSASHSKTANVRAHLVLLNFVRTAYIYAYITLSDFRGTSTLL